MISEGISADPEKVYAIIKWPVSSNVAEIRSFLGTPEFYRRFNTDYAKIAQPLNMLLACHSSVVNHSSQGLRRKPKPRQLRGFGEKKQSSFDLLKGKLLTSTVSED